MVQIAVRRAREAEKNKTFLFGQSFVGIAYQMSCPIGLSEDHLCILVAILCTLLFLSLLLNVVCCTLRCSSGKVKSQEKKRQRVRKSQRHMEENPIYGNLGYNQTSQALFTEVDPPLSRNQARVTSDSQEKIPDCYANLTLKPPVTQSGRNSPKVQYSDVVHLETAEPAREKREKREEVEEEKGNREEADSTDVMSTVSDLYASVQTQRTKTIDPAVEEEAYANHL